MFEERGKIHFDNIVQKASSPISKINGKTSQSKFRNGSASALELCRSAHPCPLSLPPTRVPSLGSAPFRMPGIQLGGNY